MWNTSIVAGYGFLAVGLVMWGAAWHRAPFTPVPFFLFAAVLAGVVVLMGIDTWRKGMNQCDYEFTFGIATPDKDLGPVIPDGRESAFLTGHAVNRTLRSLAVTLDELCRLETVMLETKVLPAEMERERHKIQRVQRNVKAAKMAFWRAHRLAKTFGHLVEKSYKNYLPSVGGGAVTG